MIGLTSYKVTATSRAGGEEKLLGMFMIYDQALTKAANRVMDDLMSLHKPGQSAKELFDVWCEQGFDIRIAPDDNVPYNSANLARGLVPQVALDVSLPLLIEVSCTDCLIMPSGMASPAKTWMFYVFAPAVYEGTVKNEGDGVAGLMRRATEIVYEDMSAHAMSTEGSSYKLLDMKYRIVPVSEDNPATAKPENQTIYYVQLDGTFGKAPPMLP